MNLNSPLRDVTGRYLTRALFIELTDKEMAEKYPPRCTIKEAHDLYLEIADPTEYEFAKALLWHPDTTFWDHWQRLLNTPDFVLYLEKWRRELEVMLRSQAAKTIKETAQDPNSKGAVNAAKWLADKGWDARKGAGRPTKDEVAKERKIAADIADEIDNDEKRVSLVN